MRNKSVGVIKNKKKPPSFSLALDAITAAGVLSDGC